MLVQNNFYLSNNFQNLEGCFYLQVYLHQPNKPMRFDKDHRSRPHHHRCDIWPLDCNPYLPRKKIKWKKDKIENRFKTFKQFFTWQIQSRQACGTCNEKASVKKVESKSKTNMLKQKSWYTILIGNWICLILQIVTLQSLYSHFTVTLQSLHSHFTVTYRLMYWYARTCIAMPSVYM